MDLHSGGCCWAPGVCLTSDTGRAEPSRRGSRGTNVSSFVAASSRRGRRPQVGPLGATRHVAPLEEAVTTYALS